MGDEDELADDERLWRRVHSSHFLNGRVTSAAFTDLELSVDRAVVREAGGLDHLVTKRTGACVAEFTVAAARSVGMCVKADAYPVTDPTNDAHALVIGPKTQSTRNYLKSVSQPLF